MRLINLYPHPLPPGLRDHWRRGSTSIVKARGSEYFPDMARRLQTASSSCDCMHKACTRSNHTKSLGVERLVESLPSWGAIGGFRRLGSLFSWGPWPLSGYPQSGLSYTWEYTAAPSGLNGCSVFCFLRAHEIGRKSAEEIGKELEEKGWGRN